MPSANALDLQRHRSLSTPQSTVKLQSYELFQVPPRWLFLKVVTDEGLVGWGEPIVEGKAATVRTAVTELMELLMGKDPLNIEDHWNLMYRGGFYRGVPVLMSAISGIDQALWDIKGKCHQAPIHQLMGGRARDKMRVYAWLTGDTPDQCAASARDLAARGFTALKTNATNRLQYIDSYQAIDFTVKRIAAVREAVGPDVGIGIDFHGRLHKAMAKVMACELESLRPMFLEEPVLPENNEVLRDIAHAVSTPLATGERMFSRWHFKQVLIDGYIDIVQPDLSHAGGLTECKKIASMAEAFDVAVAPHCPLGPIALAACLQLDASCHNAFIQEQSLGIHQLHGNELLDYIKNPEIFTVEAGFVSFPSGPGLGVEVDEEKVRERAQTGHNWHNPLWRHEDNSVAEW